MLISFGYDISLRLEVETAVLFCLRVHPSRREDIVSGENFRIEPQSPFEQYLDGFGNTCGRVHCKPGIIRFVNQGGENSFEIEIVNDNVDFSFLDDVISSPLSPFAKMVVPAGKGLAFEVSAKMLLSLMIRIPGVWHAPPRAGGLLESLPYSVA